MRPVGSKGRRRGTFPLAGAGGSDAAAGDPAFPVADAVGVVCKRKTAAHTEGCPMRSRAGAAWRAWSEGARDIRDLARNRAFEAVDPDERPHLPDLVLEVYVAARRLRRTVPLGIRPNGTVPFREERPSSDLTQLSRSSSSVFIMRKVVAAIRWRNMLSAVLLAIREPAGQANNPTCRRLQYFFVLTKGMCL